MVKEGYKQTEIGAIPEDWDCLATKHLMKIETGSRNTEHKTDAGKYPFFVRSQKVEHIDTFHYDCEAVLTAGDGVGTGKVFHHYVGKFDAHQRVYVMSNFNGVIGRFFYNYFSENFGNEVSKYTAKSSVDSVRRDMIAEMIIPLPPLSEQKHIAEALLDVDDMISSLEKLIEKKKAIKQGAMQDLLTGKKRLSGFTGEWCETTIGEHCFVFDGTHQTPKYTTSGIPFYSVENVTANDFANTKFISGKEHKQLTSKCKIEKGDILMTRIGSIGDCKYVDWDVNASFYVSLALIKCKETINPQFLSFYSNSTYFKKEVEVRALLTAIPQKINLGPISEIRLNIPSDIKEQEAIASILSDMDSEIEELEQKLNKTRKLKQGMMQQLLTGKIRLVEKDTVIEPVGIQNNTTKTKTGHNHQFDDAVMIAAIVNAFYSEKYPLGRKKVQKLLYLLRRKQEVDTSAFKKKAAGPYADEVRYKGGEPIAKSNGYISASTSKKGTSFSKGKNIDDALSYVEKWDKQADIDWLFSTFKYVGVNDLELYATVDMAICDLKHQGVEVTVDSIKNLIRSDDVWKAKLKKSYFSDADIARAIAMSKQLFFQ